MIYTLISDLGFSAESKSVGKELLSSHCPNDKAIFDEKRDCRILRQPLSLLPEEIKIFIENTKNEKTRSERYLAYTTLLCGVKIFFGIKGCTVAKTPDGKPYLIAGLNSDTDDYHAVNSDVAKSNAANFDALSIDNANFDAVKACAFADARKYQKNEDLCSEKSSHQKNIDFTPEIKAQNAKNQNQPQLYISISHSDGVVAVCISDEGEVGVDIQSEISAKKAERLEKRFLADLNVSSEELNISYYYCNLSENEAKIEKITLSHANIEEFTSKWAYSESVMKLYGRGFGDLKRLNELVMTSQTEIKEYICSAPFVIATSIKKK